MKLKIAIVGLLAVFAVSAMAQIGGTQIPFSYTGATKFSKNGTNDYLGYTNTAKIIDVSAWKIVNINLMQSSVASNQNTTVQSYLVVKTSADGSTATVETAKVQRHPAVALTAGMVTNITLTDVSAPFLSLQLENVSPDTLSNVVVRVTGKP